MGEQAPRVADHRPDVYEEDGKWVFRASSFGGCERNLVRQAIGHNPADAPEFMLGKYEESAALEEPILRALEEQYGWRVMRPAELPQYDFDDTGQATLELPVTGGVIRCHPDAIAKCYRIDGLNSNTSRPWKLGDQRVVEVKALSVKSAPFDLGKNLNYWWQFAIEMAVTRRKGIYVVGWKDEAGELVRHEDGRVRLSVAWYDNPPETLLAIKKRAAMLTRAINDAIDGRGLPECDVKQYPCGFWSEHEGGVWEKPELEEIDDQRIIDLATRADTEKYLMEQHKVEYDRLRTELHAALLEMDKPAGEYRAGGYKVTRVVKNGRRSYDTARMADDGVPIDQYVKYGRGSDYVTVEEIDDAES